MNDLDPGAEDPPARRAWWARPLPIVLLLLLGLVAGITWVAMSDDDDESATTTQRRRTTTTTRATSTTAGVAALTMRGDGLGVITFGDGFDDVLAVMAGVLGEADQDTGDLSYEQLCDGEAGSAERCPDVPAECLSARLRRTVTWREAGIGLTFFGEDRDGLRLTAWDANPAAVDAGAATEAGLHTGEPLERWQAAYGSAMSTRRFAEYDEPSGKIWMDLAVIELPEGQLRGYTESGAPPTRIDRLEAGTVCSDPFSEEF